MYFEMTKVRLFEKNVKIEYKKMTNAFFYEPVWSKFSFFFSLLFSRNF